MCREYLEENDFEVKHTGIEQRQCNGLRYLHDGILLVDNRRGRAEK